MTFEVRWTDTSLKQLEKLDKSVARRIVEKVVSISEDPFLFVKKMEGFDLYRLRVGDYRVIMSIERKQMLVFILEVGHRSAIYRSY